MAQGNPQVDQFHNIRDKNRYRITSDNYSVILYFEQNNKLVPSEGIDLTELYGLSEFSWESNDEIEIRKPVTRVESISFIKTAGFNLDFTFIRENDVPKDTYGDIMNLIIANYRMYLNTYSKLGIPETQQNLVSNNIYKRFGQNFYTDKLAKASPLFGTKVDVRLEALSNNNVFVANDKVSRFNEPARHVYIPANCVIEVRIKNTNKVFDSESYDSYRFGGVTLYKPSQSVSENSSFIMNKFKGFASYLENEFVGGQKDAYANLVDNNIAETLDISKGVDRFLRRTIINPNNK